MTTAGNRLAKLARGVRFEHRDGGVVHQDDHRGRPTSTSQPLDDLGSGTEPLALAANLRSTQDAKQASLAEPCYSGGREFTITIDG